MKLEDIPAVVRIDYASFSNPWPESTFRYELTKQRGSCFLVGESASADRRIVAFLGFWMLMDEAHISTFAVDPTLRRRGIGTTILMVALREALKRGAKAVTLEVRESNEAAITLYENLGFERIGRRRGYYRDNNEDALMMMLEDLAEFLARSRGGEGDG